MDPGEKRISRVSCLFPEKCPGGRFNDLVDELVHILIIAYDLFMFKTGFAGTGPGTCNAGGLMLFFPDERNVLVSQELSGIALKICCIN